MHNDNRGKEIGAQLVMSDGAIHDSDDLRNPARRDTVVVPFPQRGGRDAQPPRQLGLRAAKFITAGERGIHGRDVLQRRSPLNKSLNKLATIGPVDRNAYTRRMNSPKVKRLASAKSPKDFGRFGDWLADLCAGRRGMQKEIADIAGTGRPIVSIWISGKKRGRARIDVQPNPEAVKRLADAFGVSKPDLLALAGYDADRPVIAVPPSTLPHVLSDFDRDTARMFAQWNKLQGTEHQARMREVVIAHMQALNEALERMQTPVDETRLPRQA